MIINIFKEIDSDAATTIKDGEKIFEKADKLLFNDEYVTFDFEGIKFISPTFLNIAIGQLYGDYKESFLKRSLKVYNMCDYDKIILDRVVTNAKEYFNKLNNED